MASPEMTESGIYYSVPFAVLKVQLGGEAQGPRVD